ncbi:glycoside hydrolase family 36 protein [Nonomuraea sp. NPDC051941]|uniref:glycoside hydrolase family 36 protein n=1 Tax=Nonomuraea sp. NPDC051941 TaxID=3364373 RepID=UPI0037C6DED0
MQLWQPRAVFGTTSARVGDVEIALDGEVTVTRTGDRVWELDAPEASAAQWRVPCVEVSAYWTPRSGARWVPPIWNAPMTSRLTSGSPVASLVGRDGANVCTVALADVAGRTSITGGVMEETGEFAITVQGRGLRIRLDLSDRHFSAALTEVATWWGEQRTPRQARLPAYSTWYSLHQKVDEAGVEGQAALAKELGCDTIIVDDGWQTADRARGYAHCGDWEPNAAAFPDMAAHVERVHGLGVAYLLWYAIPFIGKGSAAFARFEGKFLRYLELMDAAVLDPRHPDVRAYLVGRLARAVEEWKMDGLKIDFVDQFATPGGDPEPTPGADCSDVDEGVLRLMAELDARLPGILVEYRQPYTSAGLWPYGNMIRATDCPLSPQENRQRTVDLRLISGQRAVHSDMIMWHPSEPDEQVAIHLINALFSVPQISVDLQAQRPGQLSVIRFWLGIFREFLDTLQLGTLEPEQPEHGFPLVRTYDGHAMVIARYAPLPVEVPATGWAELLVANAAGDTRVVLYGEAAQTVTSVAYDCRGTRVSEARLSLAPGATLVTVPVGGLLRLRRTEEEI